MNDVIVFGGNHHNGLGIIRSLGRKGISPIVLIHENLPEEQCNILKSRYIKYHKYVRTTEEGIEWLLSEADKWQEKPVIICYSDGASSAIDMHYDILSVKYYIPGCGEKGKITRLMNKEHMATAATTAGLMVPQTVVVEDGLIPANITYPCITKPLLSIEGEKADIKVCNDEMELKDVISNSKCPRFQVQKFIKKSFEYQLIGTVVGGEIIIPGRTRIISQPICTNTGYLHYEHLDGQEPIVACERFLKDIGYSGLFSMEFLRGEDGNDYFMEINFRNDGNSISVTEAGVNLHYIWYAYNIGANWQEETMHKIREIYVMPEFTELNLWYGGMIGFGRFMKEWYMSDVYMDYAKDDPAPTQGMKKFYLGIFKHILFKPLVLIKHRLLLRSK